MTRRCSAIVEKLIKQRKDSIEQFAKAGRTDLVDKEKAELDLLVGYLPQQMSDAELASAVEAAIAESGAAGPQGMGKVMALLKPRIAGRADMGKASALVKQRLCITGCFHMRPQAADARWRTAA